MILVVVFLVVWGLITHGTYAGSGDEPHYLMIAQSLAFDGDLDLANNYAQPGNLIGAGRLQPELHALPGRDGALRPVHDVGMPLLFAPYVRIAYPVAELVARQLPPSWMDATRLTAPLIFRHLISLAMAIVAGVLGTQLFALFVRMGASPREGMLWALLLTLSPPLLSHAFLFFTEIPSALLVAWLVNVINNDRGSLDQAGPDHRRIRWLVIGGAIGLLLLIHVRNVALVIVFFIWAAVRLRRLRATPASWGCLAVAVAVPLIVRTAVVHSFWGTFVTTPIASPNLTPGVLQALGEAASRAVALFFSPHFGLLMFAPIYALALPGLWVMRRVPAIDAPALVSLLGAYLVTLLLPFTNPWGVSGGFAPASRMVVQVIPILAIAVFATVRAIPARGRWLLRALVVVQLAIDMFVWQSPKVLWNGA